MPAQKALKADAIKEQFEAPSQQEQGEPLRELTMTYNAATNAVAQLAAKVQRFLARISQPKSGRKARRISRWFIANLS